jgi:hypothetical protein
MAIYFERPEWFCPLFAEFDRRGRRMCEIHAAIAVSRSAKKALERSGAARARAEEKNKA